MKISYNWIKQFINLKDNSDETSKLLTELGLEVEGISKFESIKGGLNNVVIGKVITCEKHPNADRLKVTTVDVGENENVQIVCGAPNVESGQTFRPSKVQYACQVLVQDFPQSASGFFGRDRTSIFIGEQGHRLSVSDGLLQMFIESSIAGGGLSSIERSAYDSVSTVFHHMHFRLSLGLSVFT